MENGLIGGQGRVQPCSSCKQRKNKELVSTKKSCLLVMGSENDRICAGSVSAMTSIYPQRVRFGPFEADLETRALENRVKLKGTAI
jgi:hypothetical protein